MGGKSCIRNMCVTVGTIAGLMASGEKISDILHHYPYIEEEDVYAALSYASWRSEEYDLLLTAS